MYACPPSKGNPCFPAQVACCCVVATAIAAPQAIVTPTSSQPLLKTYPIIPYSYQYEVQDAVTGNYQNKAEMKAPNGDVYGSYSVLMPDGYIYTTTYNVTATTGYVANLVKTLATQPFVGNAADVNIDVVPSDAATRPTSSI
ncbi:Insect cuticle protein [Trinorchestia longiramus]|nr:Insect cuticle protein [Trinorchestia longiramus]